MTILRSVLFGVAVHFGIGLAAIAFFLVTFRGGGRRVRADPLGPAARRVESAGAS